MLMSSLSGLSAFYIDPLLRMGKVSYRPEGTVNLTYSPDSTKMAFTRDNNLWVVDIATRGETQLTFTGPDRCFSLPRSLR